MTDDTILYVWTPHSEVYHNGAGPGHNTACVHPVPPEWERGKAPPAGRRLCGNCRRVQDDVAKAAGRD